MASQVDKGGCDGAFSAGVHFFVDAIEKRVFITTNHSEFSRHRDVVNFFCCIKRHLNRISTLINSRQLFHDHFNTTFHPPSSHTTFSSTPPHHTNLPSLPSHPPNSIYFPYPTPYNFRPQWHYSHSLLPSTPSK